jgi:hypothetical protein
MKKLYSAVTFVALTPVFALFIGCGSVKPTNPQQQVFEISQTYEDALEAALVYDNLPDCTPGVTVCSTKEIRQKIKVAKDAASPAIKAAQTTVRDPNFSASTGSAVIVAAENAVAALAAITAALPQKSN